MNVIGNPPSILDGRAKSPHGNRSRLRSLCAKLLLAVTSAAISLGVAEVILRATSPGYSPLFLDIYTLDENGLLALQPSVVRRHVSSEWDVSVAINGWGLRDVATAPKTPARTILGLGDSFAFGWGVELHESFLSQAESRLADEPVRIVKAGFPGTGPCDQLAWLEAHGDEFAPDAVLLSFFIGNDFTDDQMGGFDRQFTIEDGLIVRREFEGEPSSSPVRSLIEWTKRRSLLAQTAAQTWWTWERSCLTAQERGNPGLSARDRWLWEFFQIHLRNPPDEVEAGFEAALRSLDGIRGWCSQRDIPLQVMIIPRSFQLYDWELAEWLQSYDLLPADLDLDRPQRILCEWAADRRVAVLDLTEPFREDARKSPDNRLFFYPNSHMNAHGHTLAGRLLAEFLHVPPGKNDEKSSEKYLPTTAGADAKITSPARPNSN